MAEPWVCFHPPGDFHSSLSAEETEPQRVTLWVQAWRSVVLPWLCANPPTFPSLPSRLVGRREFNQASSLWEMVLLQMTPSVSQLAVVSLMPGTRQAEV